jgi:hypothetical protein
MEMNNTPETLAAIQRLAQQIEEQHQDLLKHFGRMKAHVAYTLALGEVQANADIQPTAPTAPKPPILSETVGAANRGHFWKAARGPLFKKTGLNTLATAMDFCVESGGKVFSFRAGHDLAAIDAAPGSDLEIWITPSGQLVCHTHPKQVANDSRKIGGFHFAPGGNATARSGGDTTPQINEFSMWDLKFRPACSNPRGMTLVAGAFWADIYLLAADHLQGTSVFASQIADRLSPAKRPLSFDGDGQAVYDGLNWWDAQEVLASHGKRLPNHQEFSALSYGTTEKKSAESDPCTNILRAPFTSKWGVMLATGNLWTWGAHLAGQKYQEGQTDGRGTAYSSQNAVLFGGGWNDGAYSGSRCSGWGDSPTSSVNSISARGVCDHLNLD